MNFFRAIFRYIGRTISLITGLLLVASAYSDLVSPSEFHYASYMSLAFPILFWINIALLIVWIVRRSKSSFIIIAALILSWSSILDYSPFNIVSPTYNGGDTIKVMTFNTCCFAKMSPHDGKHKNPIIEYINKQDADIVCLQEYAVGRALNSLREEQLEKAFKEKYPYRKVFLNDNSYYESGLACLSKYPIVSTSPVIYPTNSNGSILYNVDVKGKNISVVINHLESNRFSNEDRGLFNYATTHITESDSLFGMVKRQLMWKVIEASKRRAKQADSIASKIENIDKNIIVCGDFNDTQQSYVYNKIRGNLNDAYVSTCFGPDITYHADNFYFRIDHILYGNGLTPLHTKIDKSIKDSDHYPVICTFELK